MRTILVTLAVTVVLSAACGSDESTTSSGDTSGGGGAGATPVQLEGDTNNEGSAEATGSSLEVEADDFYFKPTFIKGTPGQTISVELKNEGSASHTFTSPDLGVDEEIDSGQSATVDVTLPDSGATLFFCRFHQGQGMQGAFYFNDGDTVNASGADGNVTGTLTTGGSGYPN